MTTADRRTGLIIEADLAVTVTSQLCLVDDDLLRLSCLMILGGLPMLKDVVAAAVANSAPTPAPTDPRSVRLY